MKDPFKEYYSKYIKEQITKVLEDLEKLDKMIAVSSLQNEQFIINFYDKLNEISVRR